MKPLYKFCMLLGALAVSGAVAYPAELAELHNGFLLRLDHRETRGNIVRLYLDKGSENYVDVPGDQIARFEDVEEPQAEPATTTTTVRSIREIVNEAGYRYGIDPNLLLSLIREESGFRPKALSPKGAQGLMQLMPGTAAQLGIENPLDATANVDGGTRYLRDLLARYNRDLIKALAAYNAGPARVEQFHGVPPYPETVAYINRVIDELNHRRQADLSRAGRATARSTTNSSQEP